MSGREEVVRPKGFRVVHLALIAVVAAVNTVAAVAASVIQPFPGLAFIYLPYGIMPAFGVWFGPWAVIGGVISGVLYAPSYGMAPHLGAISGTSDAMLALIPWLAFKAMKTNPRIIRKLDYAVYVIVVVFATTLLELLYYNLLLVYVFGWLTWDAFWPAYISSGIGGLIAAFPLSLILLKVLSPYVMSSSLYVKGWAF